MIPRGDESTRERESKNKGIWGERKGSGGDARSKLNAVISGSTSLPDAFLIIKFQLDLHSRAKVAPWSTQWWDIRIRGKGSKSERGAYRLPYP
jgi:hypothetical protein